MFTPEIASIMGKRSGERRRERANALVQGPIETDDTRRRQRVLRQIDRLDILIEGTRDAELFIRLASAKERLWNLVYPKPGSLRPKAGRQERAMVAPVEPISAPTPQPVVNPPALVVPQSQPTHNDNTLQS